jgi:hypothetical protein
LQPLDDCLHALQPSLPRLTGSSRHQPPAGRRQRQVQALAVHGVPVGYFHIDIAQVSTEQGKLHLFIAIDGTSKFAFVQLHENATKRNAAAFPQSSSASLTGADRGRRAGRR